MKRLFIALLCEAAISQAYLRGQCNQFCLHHSYDKGQVNQDRCECFTSFEIERTSEKRLSIPSKRKQPKVKDLTKSGPDPSTWFHSEDY